MSDHHDRSAGVASAPIAINKPVPHDSASMHVSGEALYVDDLPAPARTLHAAIGQSHIAHAEIEQLQLDAVREADGVIAVLTAADIPGENDVGPVFPGDPLLVDDIIEYAGQALFLVIAETVNQARRAALLGSITTKPLPPILTIDEAMTSKSFVLPTYEILKGDPEAKLAQSPHRLSGRLRIGGQDHFYLEGQVALAIPGEAGDMSVMSSTQHPSEVQHLVAKTLGLADHAVSVEVRRMGGGFGGKETQAAGIACLAALAAAKTGRAVKLRLDRDVDMTLTGKRHGFRIDYDVGFDAEGGIEAITFDQAADCGYSPDLSAGIADRAMFHADNAYYLPDVRITSHRCKTNMASNTAFRGFGGPQGMMGIERVMDVIARHLDLDPLGVRKRNLYGPLTTPGSSADNLGDQRDRTPYQMKVTDNILPELIAELEVSADYDRRRQAIQQYNRENHVLKRGLALTPVKFGISFTTSHLNQAGALLHVYTDGSIQLNHGGTEMGQGLMIKVQQIVAEELQIDLDRVKITATATGKVPNTSPTAASAGTDLNGAAALAAARTIKGRLIDFAAAHFDVPSDAILFRDNHILVGNRTLAFDELTKLAYLHRVQLSATGFYKTPKIWYDRDRGCGRPFYYFAYGVAAAEVVVDTLTGEYRLLRADLLHDVGRSINPAIDKGQIEGGFVQGMGWLTAEELSWNADGQLTTHAPSTYKIPTAGDVPAAFNVAIYERGLNSEMAVHRSKAVGEPPLMLGMSVFFAISDAIASLGSPGTCPSLDAPATPERVLAACQAMIEASA
ncbi:MAG: xanthine dehydrogenase molybdopterin binding subunit [Pseudomonadota bacterium]